MWLMCPEVQRFVVFPVFEVTWKWLASGQGCWGPRPLTRELQVDSEYKLYAPRFYRAGPGPEADRWPGGMCGESVGLLRPQMRLCGQQGGDTLVTKLGCSCPGQSHGVGVFVAGHLVHS